MIFRDLATTGDGLLTAVQALDVVARAGRPLADVAGVMPACRRCCATCGWPGATPPSSSGWRPTSPRSKRGWVGEGRVLVRPSGTEPLVRVMAEAPTGAEAEAAVADLVLAVEQLAG